MKSTTILSIVVSVLGGVYSVSGQSTNPEPVGGCKAGDTPCLCSKPSFIESVSSCFTSTCLDNEIWDAIESLIDFCDNNKKEETSAHDEGQSTDGWSITVPVPSQSTAPINPTDVNTPILTASASTPTTTPSSQSDTSKAKPALIGGLTALLILLILFLALWIRRELRIKRERTRLPRRISMRRAQREGWVDMSSLERSGGVPRDMVLDFRAREGERERDAGMRS
ncbi:hypothetical protein SISNIDRAFT_531375 [Sistotremastrum niveocremeum HHB9708]|uniref:CFEM domain-containing protein n=1 Tax=Sistotremastrum niveocremeum HHB9708 TaxID=1314777 RepID=A0A164P8C1_9AGAM|nr:hypothetical protein SISNIDRAFT_531375 [Sistotremastrum niveocremeum HHB9708]